MAETREPRTDEEMARLTQYFPEVERRRVRYLAPEQLEALFQSAEVFERRMQNQVQSSLSHQLQERRNTSTLDQENQHRAKELNRRSRFKAHTTSHWLDQRKVCGNCWYTYKQSWALGHWLTKYFVANFATWGGIDVKLRHGAGPPSADTPLPNRNLAHYDHKIAVWLSDRNRYAILAGVRAWVNVTEHNTLCPNTALEVDWPTYRGALALREIQEATSTIVANIIQHWRNSCHGILTMDEWQTERQIGRRLRLVKGADLLRTDIPVAAQHSRVLTEVTEPPDEEALPVPNAEIVTDDPMTLSE